ncbi:hypothetical protein [Seramator thermalis]|uniref:hypothetical protein n=1 Tax=Seramator thermalis TaxID=2496270 RepID=UPI00101C0BF1|nr:hypothetical protein [Seramator thermalis]
MFNLFKKKRLPEGTNTVSAFTDDEFHKLYSLKYSAFIDYIIKGGVNREAYMQRVSGFICEYFPEPISDIEGIFRWIESASKDGVIFNVDNKTEYVRGKTKEIFANLLSRMKQSKYLFNDPVVTNEIEEAVFMCISFEVFFNHMTSIK